MANEFSRSEVIKEKDKSYLQVTQYIYDNANKKVIGISHFTLIANSKEEVLDKYEELKTNSK